MYFGEYISYLYNKYIRTVQFLLKMYFVYFGEYISYLYEKYTFIVQFLPKIYLIYFYIYFAHIFFHVVRSLNKITSKVFLDDILYSVGAPFRTLMFKALDEKLTKLHPFT